MLANLSAKWPGVPQARTTMGRRSRRLRKLRLRTVLLATILMATFFDVVGYHQRALNLAGQEAGYDVGVQKIYVASTHWNNEAILRKHWNSAVIALARHFGIKNVYISIYESGAWDDSKGALRELDRSLEELGVNRTIVLDPATHQDVITQKPGSKGWIDTPRNARELRRIPYLSHLRNLSLSPLETLRASGVQFDKVLFLNDVVFTVADVVALLSTNGGNYAAACSLDFSQPPNYYDTFALRDAEGHETVMQTWPYFRSSRSRSALKRNKPVPVKSCWNEMVFMDAAPLYNANATSLGPLRFRGIDDTLAQAHLEASECCLVHMDNPLSPTSGVWLNPDVLVGYNKLAYDSVRSVEKRMSLRGYLRSSWENRVRRWFTTDWFKKMVVRLRLRIWEQGDLARRERGVDCLINEMQILVSNGWKHL